KPMQDAVGRTGEIIDKCRSDSRLGRTENDFPALPAANQDQAGTVVGRSAEVSRIEGVRSKSFLVRSLEKAEFALLSFGSLIGRPYLKRPVGSAGAIFLECHDLSLMRSAIISKTGGRISERGLAWTSHAPPMLRFNIRAARSKSTVPAKRANSSSSVATP